MRKGGVWLGPGPPPPHLREPQRWGPAPQTPGASPPHSLWHEVRLGPGAPVPPTALQPLRPLPTLTSSPTGHSGQWGGWPPGGLALSPCPGLEAEDSLLTRHLLGHHERSPHALLKNPTETSACLVLLQGRCLLGQREGQGPELGNIRAGRSLGDKPRGSWPQPSQSHAPFHCSGEIADFVGVSKSCENRRPSSFCRRGSRARRGQLAGRWGAWRAWK